MQSTTTIPYVFGVETASSHPGDVFLDVRWVGFEHREDPPAPPKSKRERNADLRRELEPHMRKAHWLR